MYCTIDKVRQYVVRLGFYASIHDFENVAPIYRQINELLASIQSDFSDLQLKDLYKSVASSDELDESSDDVRSE